MSRLLVKKRVRKPVAGLTRLAAAAALLVTLLVWLTWFLGADAGPVVHPTATQAEGLEGADQERGPVLPGFDVAEGSPDDGAVRGFPDLNAQPSLAQSQMVADGGPATAIPGRIAGVVLSEATDLPVESFVLRLHHGGDPGADGWSGAETHRVHSPRGSFDLGHRQPGAYALQVSAPEHRPLVLTHLVVPGADGLRLHLSAGARMSGWITDAFGRDAVDLAVELRPLGGAAGEGTRFVRRGQTDGQGRFAFGDVGPGEWQVVLPDPHDRSKPLGLSPPWTASHGTTGRWDAQLPPMVDLHVEVLCQGAPAAPGTRVRLVAEAGQVVQCQVGGGWARFSLLRPGAYELIVTHGDGSSAWNGPLFVRHALEPNQHHLDIPPPLEQPAGDS